MTDLLRLPIRVTSSKVRILRYIVVHLRAMNPIKSELHRVIDPAGIKCSEKIKFLLGDTNVIKSARQKIWLRGFCGSLYVVSL